MNRLALCIGSGLQDHAVQAVPSSVQLVKLIMQTIIIISSYTLIAMYM